MTKKSAIKSKHNSTVVSVAVGTILAVILSLVGATIGSVLLDGGKTSESAVYPVTIVTWIVSAFLGTFATMKLAGEIRISTMILTNICYLAILVGTGILFFETNSKGLIPAFLSIIAGNIPVAFGIINRNSKRTRKYRYKSK